MCDNSVMTSSTIADTGKTAPLDFDAMLEAAMKRLKAMPEGGQTAWYKEHMADKEAAAQSNYDI